LVAGHLNQLTLLEVHFNKQTWWVKSSLGKQGAKADLMQDALASERFRENADHEAEHGGATIEKFGPLELFAMDLAGGSGLIPLAIGLETGAGHREKD